MDQPNINPIDSEYKSEFKSYSICALEVRCRKADYFSSKLLFHVIHSYATL